nr:papain inhibitor [Quercus suber]
MVSYALTRFQGLRDATTTRPTSFLRLSKPQHGRFADFCSWAVALLCQQVHIRSQLRSMEAVACSKSYVAYDLFRKQDDVVTPMSAGARSSIPRAGVRGPFARAAALMSDSEGVIGGRNATKTDAPGEMTGRDEAPRKDGETRASVQDVEWDQAGKQAYDGRRRWPFGSNPMMFARNKQSPTNEYKSSPSPADKTPSSNSDKKRFGFLTTTPFAFQRTFDRLFPPHQRYLGRFSRKSFLIILGIMLFGAIALTIGLAAGLTILRSDNSTAAPDATGTFSGDLTYFTDGLGACGQTSGPDDPIVALSEALFDPQTPNGNPNNNPLCGRTLTAFNGDASIVLTVVDRCTGCAMYDLDTTQAAFSQLADPSLGRVPITWSWN